MYHSLEPPSYDLGAITSPPLAIFHGGLDKLADPGDVATLLLALPQGAVVYEQVRCLGQSWQRRVGGVSAGRSASTVTGVYSAIKGHMSRRAGPVSSCELRGRRLACARRQHTSCSCPHQFMRTTSGSQLEPTYQHLDLTWGIDARQRIYPAVLQLLARFPPV